MIEIYVFSGIIIGGIIGIVISMKKGKEGLLFCLSIVLAVLSGFIMTVEFSGATTNTGVLKTLNEYQELSEKVEAIKNSDDKALNIFKADLLDETYEMNKIIKNNRDHYQSKWNGFKYSEDLANLKEIELW